MPGRAPPPRPPRAWRWAREMSAPPPRPRGRASRTAREALSACGRGCASPYQLPEAPPPPDEPPPPEKLSDEDDELELDAQAGSDELRRVDPRVRPSSKGFRISQK